MAHPYHHALSSARRYGGRVEDYLPIHARFDESKAFVPDFRHRTLRHHAEGIFLCERLFGTTLINRAGRVVPVRYLGEQHVKEDPGRIPTAGDWLRCLRPEPWMIRPRKLERDLEQPAAGEGETAALSSSGISITPDVNRPTLEKRPHGAGAVKSLCPSCSSDDLADGSYRTDAGFLTDEMTCRNCQQRWRAVYTLCRLETLAATPALEGV